MKKTFKGSPLFNEVKDTRLQTWNRCAIIFNLRADRGSEAASEYAKQLGEEDRKRCLNMFGLIEKYGYDAIRKRCTPQALEV